MRYSMIAAPLVLAAAASAAVAAPAPATNGTVAYTTQVRRVHAQSKTTAF